MFNRILNTFLISVERTNVNFYFPPGIKIIKKPITIFSKKTPTMMFNRIINTFLISVERTKDNFYFP